MNRSYNSASQKSQIALGCACFVLALSAQTPMMNPQQPDQPRGGFSGCIAGKPFEATFHRTGALDNNWWVSSLARDRWGTTRTDLSNGQFTHILNCRQQQSIKLVHPAKLAIITPVTLQGSAQVSGFQMFPPPTNEVETILNVVCRRVLLYEDKEETTRSGELWVNKELGVVMRDIKGSSKWEAISFVLGDPKASLFDIPADYTRQQTPAIEPPR